MSRKRKKPSQDPRKNAAEAYRAAYQCGHCNGYLGDGPDGWGVYHEPGCPVAAGAVDGGAAGRRAAAAASEATGEAVIHGSWFRDRPPGPGDEIKHELGPRAMAIVRRTAEMCLHKETCPHQSRTRMLDGQPAAIMAHRPDIVLCLACSLADAQRVSGTREDATCDYCHTWQPEAPPGQHRIYGNRFHLPAEDLDITVHYGLCPSCWEADQAGTPL